MDRYLLRTALAAVLGLGILPGLARAQAVRIAPETAPGPEVVSEPVPVDGAMVGSGVDNSHPAPPGRFPQFRAYLMGKGVACWTSHNSPGCGSFKADCIFIFGSCRQFFGEPCFGGPPPSPAEYYYRMQGYGGPMPGQGAPARGCGCQ